MIEAKLLALDLHESSQAVQALQRMRVEVIAQRDSQILQLAALGATRRRIAVAAQVSAARVDQIIRRAR